MSTLVTRNETAEVRTAICAVMRACRAGDAEAEAEARAELAMAKISAVISREAVALSEVRRARLAAQLLAGGAQ